MDSYIGMFGISDAIRAACYGKVRSKSGIADAITLTIGSTGLTANYDMKCMFSLCTWMALCRNLND